MAERIILGHQAPSTKTAYEKIARELEIFRGDQPRSEAIVLAFLAKEAESKAPTTLWTTFSLLKKNLLLEHSFDLGGAERITDFLKTLSRTHKKKKALAFSRDEVFRFLSEAPSDGHDLTRKLVLLAGLYGGLRGCELVALTWDDITFSHDGILLRIAYSKTDRAGLGFSEAFTKA